MSRILGLALAVVCPLAAEPGNVSEVLQRVEDHYNRIKTLEVRFVENYNGQGRVRKGENGVLLLRKPGKMRWNYDIPAGKMFLSDGKSFYFYTPNTHRVEKVKMKESEDMRAPLAFLLGKLDFHKEFQDFRIQPEGDGHVITAVPKSDRLPYSQVVFHIGAGSDIRRLTITGQDQSILDFTFEREVQNPSLDEKQFKFEMPPGAEFLDTSK